MYCRRNSKNPVWRSITHLDCLNGYKDGEKQGGTGTDSTVNSHIFGTDVIIVTYGDSMNMYLIVPPPGRTSYRVSAKDLGLKKSRDHMVTTKLEHYSRPALLKAIGRSQHFLVKWSLVTSSHLILTPL